ncbi:MAG: OmpA family protein, partial [Deltaproteobacteria bacterium]|nr:OmpA family protein [Deltaproteobacteria bacterium]
VDPNGDWSCDSASLADGTYTLGAYQVDLAGNVGAAATNPLEVDAHVPQTPMLDALASPSKIPIVTLTGSGEAHTSVAIRDQGSTVRCSITDAPVSFTCDTSALPDGAYTFTAIASSRTGVQSAPSNAVTIVIDSTPPAAPHLDDVPSPTAQHRPSFAGTAEPLAAVDVLADGAIACSTNADASGNFVCSSVPVLNNGPHTAHARATDLVGNVSDDSNTVSFTIDDTAAPAPVLDPLAVPEGGEAGFTRETKPTFTGTGVPGDALTVRLGSGTALCDTTVQPDGSFSCTSTFALTGTPATAYTAVAAQTSPTAVTGPDSNTISFTVDTHVPAAPDLTQPASPTTNRQPQLIGSAELLAHIAVRAATSTSASAPVTTLCTTTATTGTFACAPLSPLADGIYQLTAIATSRAGVTSTPSSPVRTLVVGTTTSTPPTAPVIDAPVNGAELADPRPVISGHGQANLTIRVTLDGAALADVTSDATGQWSATPASDVAPGQHKATAVAVDVAGVTSPPSAEVDFSTYANGEVRGGCASTSGDLWALLGLLALFGLARPRGRRALAWSLPRLAREGLLRSQRARVLGPLAFLLLALGGAHGAQAADPSSIDLTRLRPATGPDGALGIDGARPPNADEPRLSFSLLFDAAWQPLVFFPQGGQRQVLIDDRIGAWLTAQSYVAGPVSLVAQLPALLGQQADTSALPPAQRPASSSGAALGDLRLGARVGLLRQERWPLDLAAQLMVSLPTASSGSLAGAGSATAEVSLQASRRVLLFALWDVELLGNALVRLRPARELADVQLGNELGLRAAASWYPDAGSAAVPKRFFLAFDGDLSLRSGTAGGAAPAEWRVGASFCAGSAVALDFGAGTALSSGVGSPRARFLFGLDWAPTTCAQRVDVRTPRYQPDAVAAQGSPEAKTAIVQKLPAREASAKPPANPSAPSAKPAAPAPAAAAPAASTPAAASPTIAKAPAPAGSAPAGNANMAPMVADIPIAAPPMVVASLPDQDGDGVPDADDQCPLVPGPASNRGCPEKAGAISKGPATAELDDLLGAGQVPIAPLVKAEKPAAGSLDRDGDGVPNDEDSCPDKAGPPGNAGCPLSQKMLVSIKGERIALQARIEFAEGSAALEKRSLPLIAQLAEVLQAHPEIERVEVAAHVDSSLGEQGGKALSAARAEAVIAQLSKDGVHIDRLEAAAMGMKHPIAPNATKGGRLQNQRIELRILERRTAAGPKARG